MSCDVAEAVASCDIARGVIIYQAAMLHNERYERQIKRTLSRT